MIKSAPYVDPEITSCLSHLFKRRGFGAEYPERFNRGKHGLEMPPVMVALITTAVSSRQIPTLLLSYPQR